MYSRSGENPTKMNKLIRIANSHEGNLITVLQHGASHVRIQMGSNSILATFFLLVDGWNFLDIDDCRISFELIYLL